MIAQWGAYADENPFRFSTKYHDDETGLYYYGHRYYHAKLGRWINRDPAGEVGGWNLYGFVNNSPLNRADILGLQDSVPGYEDVDRMLDRMGPQVSPYKSQIKDRYDEIIVDLAKAGLAATGGQQHIPVVDPGTGQTVVLVGADAIMWTEATVSGGALVRAGVTAAIKAGKLIFLRGGREISEITARKLLVEGVEAGAKGVATSGDDAARICCRKPNWKQSKPDSSKLRKNLGLEPGDGYDAHHVVPGDHRRAQKARDLLDEYQIDINSADNGVPLRGSKGDVKSFPADAQPRNHKGTGLHSYEGIDAVTDRLFDAIEGVDDWATARERLLQELAAIKAGILCETFP